MLYPKNSTSKLDIELFRNPTAEYRGAPFWAWNCKLTPDLLQWQIEIFKKMGFGGAHLHPRTGLATPYLSETYMDMVKTCVEKSKQEQMLTWLYDEDRWPSGAAGGLVTQNKKYRAQHLLFTPVPYGEIEIKREEIVLSTVKAVRTENGSLLTCFDIRLDDAGKLIEWHSISEDAVTQYEKWYAYVEWNWESPWYNNQDYVNTLDKEAIDLFIEKTHEQYDKFFADEFGKSIPAIFSDEAQFPRKTRLPFAKSKTDVMLPWVHDLTETFEAAYPGENLLEGLPELFWEKSDGSPSVIRYHFHDHICQRFTEAFADNCGEWCERHGLSLTGHMIAESTLSDQTFILGEMMRPYRKFQLPGIDMLCRNIEYTTAKQAQSIVHQYGREGMVSELYGVTNWDFDFRDFKLHGDWQAAMGVTIRAHHLAWASMAGESKRDYPPCINYQSPYWERYSWIEDHFSRINTALTRGKPMVRVGLIHPIESMWLHWGPDDQTSQHRKELDKTFLDITNWLVFGGIDFDYISESLLPELCKNPSAPLKVGEMSYDLILVAGCETLRTTTYKCLEAFQEAGGTLVFAGDLPSMENARFSSKGVKLAQKGYHVSLTRNNVLKSVEQVRFIEIRNKQGLLTNDILHQLRQDETGQWLFLAHGKEPRNKDISGYQDLTIRLNDRLKASIYNTITAEIESIEHYVEQDHTIIKYRMYDYDSLLLWLEPIHDDICQDNPVCSTSKSNSESLHLESIDVPSRVSYTLSEPNVLLLDQAEYALDDEPWHSREEILRLDEICRQKLNIPSRKCHVAQPWVLEEEVPTHYIRLRFRVQSQSVLSNIQLAIEDAEQLLIKWNGEEVNQQITGWYVDRSLKTILLPPVQAGENVLEVQIPFGKCTHTEWAYLLGDFCVEMYGRDCVLAPLKEKLAFGDIVTQGFPFYGGNITYHIPIKTKKGAIRLRSSQYRGTLQEVSLDQSDIKPVIYPPYTVNWNDVHAGEHTLNLTLYGHRRNSFGPVHLTDLKDKWIAPIAWRSEGERWCYEYRLCEVGILTTPEIVTVSSALS